MNTKRRFRNQIIALLIFTTLAFSFSSCKKDSFEEPQSDTTNLSMVTDGIQSEAISATGVTSSSYYLVNSLPSGYVKDGSRDYTSYIQAAVTKYSNIVFPGFPLLINDAGIVVGSNKTITFQDGSELRLKPTSKGSYSILRMQNVSDITLYNPVIVGDRYKHTGTTGEYGMGIGMWGASNVTIYNAKVSDCWGDGIYIGHSSSRPMSKNIVIKDAYLRKNRRDGISVISVDGLLVDNLYAGYTDGTSPMSGINIESDSENNEIKNVRFNNPRTENNGKNGIQIGLARMLGGTNKYIDITIVNHVDIGSPRFPFKVSASPKEGITGKIYGLINIVNPKWHKTALETKTYLWLGSNQSNLKTKISTPEIMSSTGSILSWSATYDLLMKATGGVLSVTNVVDPILSSTAEPSTSEPIADKTGTVVFAVNAGGSSFKASNGITYSADKNYLKGSVYKTSSAISNTTDDILYQSERFGNFSYAVPLSNGTYEITFKMAEIFHKAAGKRQFDILAENNSIISDLDLFSKAGLNVAYDVVKTVSVTDGTLNISFRTDIDNAKLSSFHIIKK